MAKRVFISWSKSDAKKKGSALRTLLRYVLPDAEVFMSDEDIQAGTLWLEAIKTALDESVAGVVIVTKENINSPWLHFEAGSLSTRVDKQMVIPLLSGVKTSDISDSPLSVFQAKTANRDNILLICKRFAVALGIERSEADIEHIFNKFWGDYESVFSSNTFDLTKPPPSLENVLQVLNRLDRYARAQSDALADLVNRTSVADGIKGQGPLATMSAQQAYDAILEPSVSARIMSSEDLFAKHQLAKSLDDKSFRIIVRGESWIGHKKFDEYPKAGEIFRMGGGRVLQVEDIVYDPINDVSSPDMLLIAQNVKMPS